MKEKLLHTPEGVRDIYNSECKMKLSLQKDLHQILAHYGFQDIQTPSFEFFDIFNHERGTISSKNMYKFYDREGNTLVLRPDITPSIARCAAKYFKNETFPIRLCYIGNTYINNSSYQGKLKEVTQLGAELINDSSIEADTEMLALTIDCLQKAGLKEFQVVVGDADFFRSIVEEAGFLDDDEIDELRILIENKNMFGVEEMLNQKEMEPSLKEVFLKLPELFGTVDILEFAKKLTNNHRANRAIERLVAIYENLKEYEYENNISFDLGMLSQYNYYTGIIFKAYTYGTGDAVATGGRYDNLVGQFGKEAPAIGLAIVVDQLMMALDRQKLLVKPEATDTLIVYEKEFRKPAIELTKQFRKDSVSVVLMEKPEKNTLEELIEYSKRNGIGGILYLKNEDEIEVLEAATGDVKVASMKQFFTC